MRLIEAHLKPMRAHEGPLGADEGLMRAHFLLPWGRGARGTHLVVCVGWSGMRAKRATLAAFLGGRGTRGAHLVI